VRDRFLSRVAVACLSNAISLAESADLLRAAGKTGPATALYVLACEELSKGQQYRATADGMASFDTSDLGKTWVLDKRHLTEHELKHFLIAAAAMTPIQTGFLRPYLPELAVLLGDRVLEVPFPEPESLPPEIRTRVDEILDSDPEVDKQMEEIHRLAIRMEDLKERGFYVDINDGKLLVPAALLAIDLERLRELFHQVLAAFAAGITGDIPNRKFDFHRDMAHRLARTQTRPTGKGFRRGDFSGRKQRGPPTGG
jgi:AbiV family abortive infection protein